jgi:hypothetical protein
MFIGKICHHIKLISLNLKSKRKTSTVVIKKAIIPAEEWMIETVLEE